jgi:hypothetical protein
MWKKLVLSYYEVASGTYMTGLRIITIHLTQYSHFRAEILNLLPSKYEATVNQLTATFGTYDIRKKKVLCAALKTTTSQLQGLSSRDAQHS